MILLKNEIIDFVCDNIDVKINISIIEKHKGIKIL